jgi:hypothetical protein
VSFDNDQPRTLSIGSVVDPGPHNRRWREAVRRLSIAVDDAQADDPSVSASSLNLNVVFHIPGRILKPEFEGVRTGSYSKIDNELMVQIALAEREPADPDAHVRAALLSAVDAAERWAQRRDVLGDTRAHRAILGRLDEVD